MAFHCEFTDLARVELIALVHWIGENSAERAERWADGLRRRIETLPIFPHRCPIALEGKRLGRPIRLLTYGKKRHGSYRILFEVTADGISMHSVRHNSRAGESLE